MPTNNVKKPRKSAKPKTDKKITPQNERFVENICKGSNQTDAYKDAYPKASSATSRVNSSRLLTNTNILAAIAFRRKELSAAANIETAQVIAAAVRAAFATIDDALDAFGEFDIVKSRQTGAIHHIKSISRTPNKFGEAVKIEMYSSADARKELADYLGIKQLPRENEQILKRTVAAIQDYFEKYPDADREKVINAFAAGRGISAEVIQEHLGTVN